jgi:hypothetical protein
MRTNELQTSKYLKKEDFPTPKLVTVRAVSKENVALPNQPKKERGVIYFQEYDKGMVLNSTNLRRAEKAFGADETDEWIGKKIVVFTDEEVEFAGEIVGGLRLRKPVPPPPPIRQVDPGPGGVKQFADMKDDIPF